MRKLKTASKSQSSSPDDNARTKFLSAATDVWSNVGRGKAKYHSDVTAYIDQETAAGITDTIITGLPGSARRAQETLC
jgi:hypothetical protein